MLAWLSTAYRAGRIAYRPTPRARRRTARIVLGLLVVDAVLLVAKLCMAGLLWGAAGWPFAQNRVLVELPVLLVPMLAVGVLAVPRLWRLARGPGEVPDRVTAADARLVVPQAAAAAAAVLGFWIVFVTRPVAPFWPDTLRFGALLAVATVAIWLRQRRRVARLGRADVTRPGAGARVLRAVGVVVVLIAASVGGLITASQASVLPGRYSMMGDGPAHEHDHGGGIDLTSLTGPVDGTPDRRFTLTAAPATVTLDSGATTAA